MTQTAAGLDIVRHIAVFEVPARLGVEQRAGEVCVWCSTPMPAGALRVDLGGSNGWSPHSCTSCYEAHRAWVDAYYGWCGHMLGCPACGEAARCDVADGYRVRLLDAVGRTGKPAVACAQCHREVKPGERFEPLLWEGNSGPVFNYTHIALCLLPKYCGRCGLLIAEGEEFIKHEHSSASAAGATVYLHIEPCRKPPTQTYPARRR